MSAGSTHVKASLIVASGFGLGAIVSFNPVLLECSVGALVGIIISPDLDVDKAFIGDKYIEQRTGWIGKKIWLWFWKPYKTSFKHGRFASHFPVFSTFVRLLYIYFWVIFLPHLVFYFLVNPNWNLIFVLTWYAKIFLSEMFFIGLVTSDTVHYFLDILTTERSQ